jgi:hypothetical protein
VDSLLHSIHIGLISFFITANVTCMVVSAVSVAVSSAVLFSSGILSPFPGQSLL